MITPYAPVSKVRKSEIEDILSNSNEVLEHYHSLVTKRQGRLGFLTTEDKNLTKIDLLSLAVAHNKEKPNEDFIYNKIKIPAEDIKKIVLSKGLEWEILCSFSPMLKKIANKWRNASSDVCLGDDDLESEAVKLAISSIYTYQKPKSLSNYIFICVNRGIRDICRKTNPLSTIGKNAIKIYNQYETTRNSLGAEATFDSIVEKAGFNKKQVGILQSMFSVVSSQSCFDDSKNSSLLDYTFLGKKFSGIDGKISYSCNSNGNFGFTIKDESNKEDNEIKIDIGVEDLSELEKIVLKGFLESPCSAKNLGINSLAKSIINPKTNKPYSRMAITYAWRRVKEKITKSLKVA